MMKMKDLPKRIKNRLPDLILLHLRDLNHLNLGRGLLAVHHDLQNLHILVPILKSQSPKIKDITPGPDLVLLKVRKELKKSHPVVVGLAVHLQGQDLGTGQVHILLLVARDESILNLCQIIHILWSSSYLDECIDKCSSLLKMHVRSLYSLS
ncbi:hypothetical protein X975_10697, partial [Stegodyphus mimosarum]